MLTFRGCAARQSAQAAAGFSGSDGEVVYYAPPCCQYDVVQIVPLGGAYRVYRFQA